MPFFTPLLMTQHYTDLSLRCGVFWLRALKYARYENLILGYVIGKPLAQAIY